jgi:hypothetical protein
MNNFGSATGTSEIISLPHSKRENVLIDRHLHGLIKKRGILKNAIFHRCRCCVCDDDTRFRKLQTQLWSSWNDARRIHGSGGIRWEEDKVEPVEHALGTEATAHPVEINGPSVDSEPAAEVEAAAPEPKKDFCDALREAAESSDIPVAFFARLLWQESRFQAFEVSRVGAQGVAQFMPATGGRSGP